MEGIRVLSGPAAHVVDPLVLRDPSGAPVVGTFRDRGRGAGVLLLHGFVGTRRMPELEAVADVLDDRYDVLSIDARGHGDGRGRFTWGREEWRQVDAAVRFLSRSRAVAVIGFSFGGYHAARAAANGAPIDRLVLVGAPVDLCVLDHFPFGSAFWRHVPAMLRKRRRYPRLTLRPRFRQSALGSEELSRIRCATLVIHSGDDFLISPRHAERYASEIPGARKTEIRDGLHAEYAVHSHKDELLREIRSFLSGIEGGEAGSTR